MMEPRTVDDVIASIPRESRLGRLPPPPYSGDEGRQLGLAVKEMENHITDEGWLLFKGLDWSLLGADIPVKYTDGYGQRKSTDDLTDVRQILDLYEPGTVLIQDKREWIGKTADRSGRILFQRAESLNGCGAFVGTVLKDAHHDTAMNRSYSGEIGCHYWVHYYHPRIVEHLSPFVRTEHLVRTWHSVNVDDVPDYSPKREGVLLSGAISSVYPLRHRIANQLSIPELVTLRHPGYAANGCKTPGYLKMLSCFKVAICTSSRYGYSLRKLVEATACGCAVLTDLPADEVYPEIDGNFTRIHPRESMNNIADLVRQMIRDYSPERQQYYADCAKIHHDYREAGRRLSDDIETLRRSYK